MDDYISREAALKVAATVKVPGLPQWNSAVGYTMEKLNSIPVADVRPVKRGKWIFDDFDGDGYDYQCLCCSRYTKKPSNYCPNCGADMREG